MHRIVGRLDVQTAAVNLRDQVVEGCAILAEQFIVRVADCDCLQFAVVIRRHAVRKCKAERRRATQQIAVRAFGRFCRRGYPIQTGCGYLAANESPKAVFAIRVTGELSPLSSFSIILPPVICGVSRCSRIPPSANCVRSSVLAMESFIIRSRDSIPVVVFPMCLYGHVSIAELVRRPNLHAVIRFIVFRFVTVSSFHVKIRAGDLTVNLAVVHVDVVEEDVLEQNACAARFG